MPDTEITTEAKPRKTRSANIPVSVKITALKEQSARQLAKAQKLAHDAQAALNAALEKLADAEKAHAELSGQVS